MYFFATVFLICAKGIFPTFLLLYHGCFWTLSQSIWSWHSSSFPLWQLKDQFRNLRFVLVQPVGSSWPGPVAWTSLDDLARNSRNVNVGRIKRLTFKRQTKQKKSTIHKSKSSNSSRNKAIKREWKRQGVEMYKINFLLKTIWTTKTTTTAKSSTVC